MLKYYFKQPYSQPDGHLEAELLMFWFKILNQKSGVISFLWPLFYFIFFVYLLLDINF